MIEVHPQTRSPLQEAPERYLFTLTFRGGQVALLNVCGASTQEEARAIAESAIKNSQYEVVAGDHTEGHAHCFYSWCTAQAQERTPRHILTLQNQKEIQR